MKDIKKIALNVIQKAWSKANHPYVLCSFGKDSILLLCLLQEADLLEEVPILYIDSGFEFPELYKHRDKVLEYFKIPDYNYVCVRNESVKPDAYETTPIFELSQQLKTIPLNKAIKDREIDFLITGIRRDEEGSRSKERYFSYRDENGFYNPSDNKPEYYPFVGTNISSPEKGHYRANPLLDWTELDVWLYFQKRRYDEIPMCPLYFSKDGKRYRSLGDAPVTTPIESEAKTYSDITAELLNTTIPERISRQKQDESAPFCMENLRRNGFC